MAEGKNNNIPVGTRSDSGGSRLMPSDVDEDSQSMTVVGSSPDLVSEFTTSDEEKPTTSSGRVVAEGVKRKGEDVLTPSPLARKKTNVGGATYAGVTCDFGIGLVPDGYPSTMLSKEEVSSLAQNIMEQVSNLSPDSVASPKFRGYTHRNGSLFLNCADEQTKTWIKELASQLKVSSGNVRVVRPEELLRHLRARAYFSGVAPARETFLRRFQIQNKQLDSREWSVMEVRPERRGFSVIYRFPETLLPLLKKNNFEVFYDWQASTVRVYGTRTPEEGKESCPPPVSSVSGAAGSSGLSETSKVPCLPAQPSASGVGDGVGVRRSSGPTPGASRRSGADAGGRREAVWHDRRRGEFQKRPPLPARGSPERRGTSSTADERREENRRGAGRSILRAGYRSRRRRRGDFGRDQRRRTPPSPIPEKEEKKA